MLLIVAVYLVLGVALGYVGGLLGIGGGLIGIPMLGLFFGYSEQAAQGTALVMIVPNVMLGLWSYIRKVGLDPRIALTLAVAALPFTFVAARFATMLPSKPLRIAFGVFILAIAAQMAYRALARKREGERRVLPWPFAAIVGAIGGSLSGIFSVGGAVFAVPVMSVFFGLSQVAAQGMGLALVAPGTVVSIATFAAAHDVHWVPGIALAAGGVFSVPQGVNLAKRLPERVLRLIFAAFMLASALGLFFRA
ncbi:MAG: sulfite exporter TauE/SafE family protein [Vulcanimicrobiaceae bacterium]